MQITIDTCTPQDLRLMYDILRAIEAAKTQPEVVDNTGSASTVLTLLTEGRALTGDVKTPPPLEPYLEPPLTEKRVRKSKVIDTPIVEDIKELTLDQVRAALQLFTAEKGVPAGIDILKAFNAGRISELTPDRYNQFVNACEDASA